MDYRSSAKKNPMGRKKETESTCEGKDQRKDWLDKCKNKRKEITG